LAVARKSPAPGEGVISFIHRKFLVMIRIRILLVGLSAGLASLLAAGSAHALNDHSWVSSSGSGNTCTRAAPCGLFMAAFDATAAGGVISVLDSGDYGAATIKKSLTIRAEGVDGGQTVGANGSGSFSIEVKAGATDVVTLEGLQFKFNDLGFVVRFDSGAHLHVVRCVFNGNKGRVNAGIIFQPNSPSRLSVTDTVISNMGFGTGGGIIINPQSGGSARVNLERVTVNGNAFGVAADGTGSTNGINMTIADSMISGNTQDGILATTPSGGAPIGVMVKNTKSVNNVFGIRSLGTNVTVRVDGSSIIGNATGLSFSGGGALQSYGNNNVDANASNGAFSGPVALK
jgi:hypothetical protein